MANRNFACIVAAGFLGVAITAAATDAHARPRGGDVTVIAPDPALQRIVSYADLNLAMKPDRRALHHRISATAGELCNAINGWDDGSCRTFAINSTRDQVARAIARAEQQMASFPVGAPLAISMVISVH